MPTTEILQIVTYIVGILGVALGIIGWVARAFLRKEIADIRKNELSELKPNGGSSIKDTVNKIHLELTDLRISVARLEGRFSQHLEDGKE